MMRLGDELELYPLGADFDGELEFEEGDLLALRELPEPGRPVVEIRHPLLCSEGG